MSRYARQLSAAQRAYDNASPYDEDQELADERRDDYIDALLSDDAWCASHKAAADESVDGTHDGQWYSDAERALADLAGVDADKLLGSDVLTRLNELAEVASKARKEALRKAAESEYDRQEAA